MKLQKRAMVCLECGNMTKGDYEKRQRMDLLKQTATTKQNILHGKTV